MVQLESLVNYSQKINAVINNTIFVLVHTKKCDSFCENLPKHAETPGEI